MQVPNYISIDKKKASINNQKYQLIRHLAKGKAILLCKNSQGNYVVIKFEPRKNLHLVSTEIEALESLYDTPNTIKLMDYALDVSLHYEKKKNFGSALILNFCNNRDLYYLIQPMQLLPFHDKELLVRTIFRSIVITLHKIYEKSGRCHRDLKPENIFIDGNRFILADWAFSTAAKTQQEVLLGTPQFASPQILRKEKYIASKNDIWSLGAILFEMLFGFSRHKVEGDIHNGFSIDKIDSSKYTECCLKISIKLRTLIEGMLEEDESKRLSLSQIIMNEWFIGDTIETPILLERDIFLTQQFWTRKQERQRIDMRRFRPTSP